MTTFLLIITFLVITFILIFFKRSFLVFSIFLIASQAFGFFHEYSFGFSGYFDINSILVIIYITTILFSLKNWKQLGSSIFLKFFVGLFVLWLFGVLYPYFLNFSALFYSIKESKEYLNYLSFFSVYLFLNSESELSFAWYSIQFFAIYFCFLEILYIFLGPSTFSFIQYTWRPEQSAFIKVYIPVFTIIIIFFFYHFYNFILIKHSFYRFIALMIFGLGILFTFFRAYILSTLFSIPSLLFFIQKRIKSLYSIIIIIPVLFTSLLVISLHSTSINFLDVFDSFVGSGIRELYHYEGGSLQGRDAATQGRYELIKQRPYFGWGFLDKDSSMGKKIRKKVGYFSGAGEIGFVDKGYLDVIAKFGIVGSIIFYAIFICIFFKLIKFIRSSEDYFLSSILFAAAGLVFVFIGSQLTHANLTRQFGILPLSIILAIIDKHHYLTSKAR